jgi:hypothetical protein
MASPDLVRVHAGVVVHAGMAILLPGRSRSGKTTLVRELLARGAEYASDEFALADSTGLVHPFPRALMLRDANMEQHAVPPEWLGARVRKEPARAGIVLFLEYQPGAGFRASPLARSATVLGLLRNTPEVLSEKPATLEALLSLARAAEAFEGIRGEAAVAAESVLHLCRAAGS